MDYKRFLTPTKEGDLVYLLRNIHMASQNYPDAYSLAAGMPNSDTFPLSKTIFHLSDGSEVEVDTEEMKEIMKYQTAKGMLKLRNWIKKIHQKYHSPPTINHPDEHVRFDVCVTSGGALGAMHILFSQTIIPGDVVIVPEFLFGGAKCCFKRAGAIMLGVPMDSKGVISESLRDILKNWKEKLIEHKIEFDENTVRVPKLFYTIPTGQNPTGVVTPLGRKKEIYKVAQEFDLLIVEDDPYYYIQYAEELEPSYQSIDIDGRVARIDSTSKLLAPGMRVGWISGPAAIVERTSEAQTTVTIAPSSLSQIAIVKMFDQWGMEGIGERIKYLQNYYKPSKDEIERVVDKYLGDMVEMYPIHGGFFMWLKLKSGKDTLFLADIELSAKHKVFAVPGLDFSFNGKSGPYIRLSFALLSRETLEEAIKRLAELLKAGIEK